MNILPIDKYLPQRRPFIMVDRINDGSDKNCTTTFTVRQDNPLVIEKEGEERFSEAGLLENIAQTCASHIGFVEIHIRKNPTIRIGVVGLYKGITINRLPRVGEVLTTHVEETENFGDLSIYRANIQCGGEAIAEGEIRVVLTDKLA